MILLSRHVKTKEIDQINENFKLINESNSGKITVEELLNAFLNTGFKITTEKLVEIIKSISNEAELSYTDFLAAVMPPNVFLNKDWIVKGYKMLDIGNKGHITLLDIQNAFIHIGRPLEKEKFLKLMSEWDNEIPGRLSYKEYKRCLLSTYRRNSI